MKIAVAHTIDWADQFLMVETQTALSLVIAQVERERPNALLSPCGTHRYWLRRHIGDGPRLVWCMLNPSTADATKDDPTIRKVKGFTQRLGYGEAIVVNLFSWRSTKPRDCLANLADASTEEGYIHIARIAAKADVVCGWGAHEWAREEAMCIVDLLRQVEARMFHLGLTQAGMPKHPLMLPYSTPLSRWDGAL